MKRKLKNSAQLLWVAAATSLTAPCPVLGDPPACPKYNVLFIISDDMRAEPGSFGGIAKTPNIDALARSGVRFERGYAQYPLCCPTRSSLLTGHAPTHTGVLGNRTWVGDLHPGKESRRQHSDGNEQSRHRGRQTGEVQHHAGGVVGLSRDSEHGVPREIPNMSELVLLVKTWG